MAYDLTFYIHCHASQGAGVNLWMANLPVLETLSNDTVILVGDTMATDGTLGAFPTEVVEVFDSMPLETAPTGTDSESEAELTPIARTTQPLAGWTQSLAGLTQPLAG